ARYSRCWLECYGQSLLICRCLGVRLPQPCRVPPMAARACVYPLSTEHGTILDPRLAASFPVSFSRGTYTNFVGSGLNGLLSLTKLLLVGPWHPFGLWLPS